MFRQRPGKDDDRYGDRPRWSDSIHGQPYGQSYDDGATWQRQDLKEKKGTWQVALKGPDRAEFVSIRVTAEQRNGGGVTQTVTRAFGLR
ncbi:hypothetical protein [Micromonospora zamorensis]|uniref:hypothetical protein n=1 Tax=Micromonospora zamorensis TaxID=709883 RepID=UPI003CE85255